MLSPDAFDELVVVPPALDLLVVVMVPSRVVDDVDLVCCSPVVVSDFVTPDGPTFVVVVVVPSGNGVVDDVVMVVVVVEVLAFGSLEGVASVVGVVGVVVGVVGVVVGVVGIVGVPLPGVVRVAIVLRTAHLPNALHSRPAPQPCWSDVKHRSLMPVLLATATTPRMHVCGFWHALSHACASMRDIRLKLTHSFAAMTPLHVLCILPVVVAHRPTPSKRRQ